MKKVFILMVAIMLPLIVLAGVFKMPGAKYQVLDKGGFRAFREQQRLMSYYDFNEWQPSMRLNLSYDPEHLARIIGVTADQYDEETGEWDEDFMVGTVTYNDQGRATEVVANAYIMGMVFPVVKQVSQFDSQSRLIHSYVYSGAWGKDGPWQIMHKTHIIYGSGTNLEVYEWDEDEEHPYTHTVMDFDAQGRMIRGNHYSSADSLNWVLSSKSEYVYHPQDTSTGADLIENAARYLPLSFLYEDYNFWGKTTSETEYYYSGEEWIPANREIWEYNELLNPVHRRDEYYLGDQWIPDYKNDFTYDANNQIDTIIGQEYNDGSYRYDEKITFTWEQVAANSDLVAPLPKLDFKVHPNPFTEALSVETDSAKNAPLEMEVYNLRGQKLYQTTTNSKMVEWNGVDLKGKTLPAGVYFVRLSQDGVSGTRRVLKLK